MKLHIHSTKDIEDARADALAHLTTAVSQALAKLAPAVGQADVYRAKVNAAWRYEQLGEPEPFIESYADITGMSADDAAAAIIQAHQADEARQVVTSE